MKNKNMRELEKHWAEQQRKMAKPAKPKAAAKKKSREDVTVREATKD